jgi:hypothetical protein
VNDLEARLLALGPEIELPPEPDVAPVVVARLRERGRKPFPWRAAAIALAVLALVLAAAFHAYQRGAVDYAS